MRGQNYRANNLECLLWIQAICHHHHHGWYRSFMCLFTAAVSTDHLIEAGRLVLVFKFQITFGMKSVEYNLDQSISGTNHFTVQSTPNWIPPSVSSSGSQGCAAPQLFLPPSSFTQLLSKKISRYFIECEAFSLLSASRPLWTAHQRNDWLGSEPRHPNSWFLPAGNRLTVFTRGSAIWPEPCRCRKEKKNDNFACFYLSS